MLINVSFRILVYFILQHVSLGSETKRKKKEKKEKEKNAVYLSHAGEFQTPTGFNGVCVTITERAKEAC